MIATISVNIAPRLSSCMKFCSLVGTVRFLTSLWEFDIPKGSVTLPFLRVPTMAGFHAHFALFLLLLVIGTCSLAHADIALCARKSSPTNYPQPRLSTSIARVPRATIKPSTVLLVKSAMFPFCLPSRTSMTKVNCIGFRSCTRVVFNVPATSKGFLNCEGRFLHC